jgi:hypothetical protein
MLVNRDKGAADRRYWTAYDHFKVEQEARAMRRAYAYKVMRRSWKRVLARLAVALAHAGAQPPKVRRTTATGI